jgi:hypothetical protein
VVYTVIDSGFLLPKQYVPDVDRSFGLKNKVSSILIFFKLSCLFVICDVCHKKIIFKLLELLEVQQIGN